LINVVIEPADSLVSRQNAIFHQFTPPQPIYLNHFLTLKVTKFIFEKYKTMQNTEQTGYLGKQVTDE
jgi:hypothetical protein